VKVSRYAETDLRNRRKKVGGGFYWSCTHAGKKKRRRSRKKIEIDRKGQGASGNSKKEGKPPPGFKDGPGGEEGVREETGEPLGT